MMNAKKISAVISALVMTGSVAAAPVGTVFTSLAPAVVASADNEKDTAAYWEGMDYKNMRGWIYDFDTDDIDRTGDPITYAYVRAYIGEGDHPYIPEQLGGYDVRELSGDLYFSSNVKSFTISKNVTSIPSTAFINVDLDNVTIQVTEDSAFAIQDGLLLNHDKTSICAAVSNSFKIPASVNKLEYCQFMGWKGKSVTVPSSITKCGDYIFEDAVNLSSVTWQASMDEIPNYCFSKCTSLKSFTIPRGTKVICSSAFAASGLTAITLPDTITEIQDSAFEETQISSITIPSSVKTIGGRAFYGTKLTSVTIPATVTKIDDYAFGMVDTMTSEGWDYKPVPGFKIYCYPNTEGEAYAKRYNIPYEYVNTQPAKTSLAKAKVKVSNQVYTGKALKPYVKVTLRGKILKKGSDYSVKYTNNTKCGKATATVTGKGGYTGTAKGYFVIVPKKAAIRKMASTKAKTLKIAWKKNGGGVSGYQIKLATNKRFTTNKKVVTIKKGTTTVKTITGLKKNKIYFAKIRAYKTVGKKKYCGAWSAVKSARVR